MVQGMDCKTACGGMVTSGEDSVVYLRPRNRNGIKTNGGEIGPSPAILTDNTCANRRAAMANLRAHSDSIQHRILPTSKVEHSAARRALKADAFAVAAEHVSHMIRTGMDPKAALTAIGRPYSGGGWDRVISAYASMWAGMQGAQQ